jgi:hypothetical protein
VRLRPGARRYRSVRVLQSGRRPLSPQQLRPASVPSRLRWAVRASTRQTWQPGGGGYHSVAGQPGRLVVTGGARQAVYPPLRQGTPHLVSTDGTGHCPCCGRAVKLCLDGTIVTHKTKNECWPGSRQQPADDASLACWLPIKDGLTPHGLRHRTRHGWLRTASQRSWLSSG